MENMNSHNVTNNQISDENILPPPFLESGEK